MSNRYRAPTANGAVLAEPDFDAIPALIEANRKRLDRSDVIIGSLPLRELRALARREVLELANGWLTPAGETEARNRPAHTGRSPDAPLLLAGHQPELSHAGVWVKNFALNGLARRLGGIPLNLVVDNDTLKSASLPFPTFRDHEPRSVRLESLAFDTFNGEVPYQDSVVRDEDLFRTFASRAVPLMANWGYEPLLAKAWDCARRYPLLKPAWGALGDEECPTTLAERITHVRRSYERDWGCDNLEVAVHHLAWCASFARFAAHILADLPRFRDVYNAAVHCYRRENGIRSANHPVPDLRRDGDWYEAPFWVWRFQPTRRPLMSRRTADRHELQLEDSDKPTEWGDSGDTDEWVNRWRTLAELGYRIRPRALTLTLFARVCLGEFFIHGIGGGKYDEVTDTIIRDYFGVEPPAYQVLSATLHLPLPGFPATADDLTRAERRVRDLHWNPQRHLSADRLANSDVTALVDAHSALAAHEPPYADHAARRAWFRAIHANTEKLRPLVGEQVPVAEAELAHVRSEVRANAILRRRDYPWVLYPEETLRPFLQRFLDV
jgi:hypothetical protein